MTEDQRRKIDIVLADDFLDDLQGRDLDTLREMRTTTDQVETELSYYRRILHGRMDLLAFELRRRSGEEKRSLIDALPEILGSGERTGPLGRIPVMFSPEIPDEGRRPIDRVLSDDFLTRISDLSEQELDEIQQMLSDAEGEISGERKAVQRVFDTIQDEITHRYKEGTAAGADLLAE